ncbi:alkaline phosphatase D family protein [Alicyclobacillus shizuokensis]|uniref:alkaline phosphatase D family protein n=1 Tax=Alicyclobacillus shizuokensis TaxID=392014 RepID=UPI000A4EBE57|nr:alkaline phosphatase D family protein [Alicyclobacillus shizuokensis]
MTSGSWKTVKTWSSGSIYVAANRLGLHHWGFLPRLSPGEGFPQSVAAGDPTPTGAVLWTRVHPSVSRGLRAASLPPGHVQWLEEVGRPSSRRAWRHMLAQAIRSGRFVLFEVARDPQFQQPALKGFAPICGDFDNVVKVDLDGRLHPKTTYYYRFVTKDGHVSRPGRFKTLPPQGDPLSSLRLGYVTCADYTNGYYHAYRFLAEEDVDLVIHLGDYIYESVADAKFQAPLPDRALRLPGGRLKATTLADYRSLYQTYRADADLQALHERHAMVAVWDDHEFANDGYVDVAPDDGLEADGDRRRAATQAWLEYMPVRIPLAAQQDAASFRLYRSLRVGNLAELILTDERLYRSPHPCGSKVMGQRYLTPGCPQMFSPSQSMLGAGVCNQREWLVDCLANSPAVWKLWLNEVHFTQLKLLGLYWNLDAWDGYSAERAWLLRKIQAARVKNFVVLTGDMHAFEASLIPSHFSSVRPGKNLGVELTTGSVTSANLKETVEQVLFARPARGLPFPPSVAKKLVQHVWKPLQDGAHEYIERFLQEVSRVISRENPWIKWLNTTEHGYCILELTPERLTWTVYSVGDIRLPSGANKQILYQCEVPSGQPSLRVLQRAGDSPAKHSSA